VDWISSRQDKIKRGSAGLHDFICIRLGIVCYVRYSTQELASVCFQKRKYARLGGQEIGTVSYKPAYMNR
jgi:hypothetical protein